jgi:hypothetical protein
MKSCIVAFVMTLLFLFAPTTHASTIGDWTGNVNMTFGWKYMDEDDWILSDEFCSIALTYDFRKKDWGFPFHVLLGIVYSWDDGSILGVDWELRTIELRAGLRKIFELSPTTRFFLSGGIAAIQADIEATNILNEDDWGVGFFADGGIYWTIGNILNLGFTGGYSWADVDLLDETIKAGGWHAGALIGVHW